MINRRSLITGLISLVAAPAIVRAGSLMLVKNMLAGNYYIGKGRIMVCTQAAISSPEQWMDVAVLDRLTFNNGLGYWTPGSSYVPGDLVFVEDRRGHD